MRCSPAGSTFGSETLALADLDFGASARSGALAEQLQGFAWLRDLGRGRIARERRAARRSGGRPLAARARHAASTRPGRRSVGRAHPLLDGLCALHPVERATRATARPCSTRWRAARAISTRSADKAPAGPRRASPPGAAWLPPACSSRAASRASPAGEAGLARALAVGPVRRRRAGQPLAVRATAAGRPARPAARLLFRGQADAARRHRGRRRGGARRASWRHARRRRAVELAGRQPGRTAAPRRADRRLRPPRPAAAPGARLGLSAAVGAGHDPGVDAAPPPPPKMAAAGLRLDAGVRNVSDGAAAAGGQLRRPAARSRPTCPTSWSRRCAPPPRTARSCSPTPIRPPSYADGSLGKGVEDVDHRPQRGQ